MSPFNDNDQININMNHTKSYITFTALRILNSNSVRTT